MDENLHQFMNEISRNGLTVADPILLSHLHMAHVRLTVHLQQRLSEP
jgi:hypothetical protein